MVGGFVSSLSQTGLGQTKHVAAGMVFGTCIKTYLSLQTGQDNFWRRILLHCALQADFTPRNSFSPLQEEENTSETSQHVRWMEGWKVAPPHLLHPVYLVTVVWMAGLEAGTVHSQACLCLGDTMPSLPAFPASGRTGPDRLLDRTHHVVLCLQHQPLASQPTLPNPTLLALSPFPTTPMPAMHTCHPTQTCLPAIFPVPTHILHCICAPFCPSHHAPSPSFLPGWRQAASASHLGQTWLRGHLFSVFFPAL